MWDYVQEMAKDAHPDQIVIRQSSSGAEKEEENLMKKKNLMKMKTSLKKKMNNRYS